MTNGGEDDEVAAVAAPGGVEEVRGEAGGEEAGGVRSGGGGGGGGEGRGEGGGGDPVEGAEGGGGGGADEAGGREEELHEGGAGGGGRRRRVGRRGGGGGGGVRGALQPLGAQGPRVSSLGGRFHRLQRESRSPQSTFTGFFGASSLVFSSGGVFFANAGALLDRVSLMLSEMLVSLQLSTRFGARFSNDSGDRSNRFRSYKGFRKVKNVPPFSWKAGKSESAIKLRFCLNGRSCLRLGSEGSSR